MHNSKNTNNPNVVGISIGDVGPKKATIWLGLTNDRKSIGWDKTICTVTDKDGNQVFKLEKSQGNLKGNKKPYYGRNLYKLELPNSSSLYHYRIYAYDSDMVFDLGGGQFFSAPDSGEMSEFVVLHSSCQKALGNKGKDTVQPAWQHASNKYDVRLNILLGDTNYANDVKWRKKWNHTKAQYKVSNYRNFMSKVVSYAIYDDHDYIDNDACGASLEHTFRNFDEENIREKAARYFRELWIVPNNEFTNSRSGVFYKISYGKVDFFFIDSMYYREPLNGENNQTKSLLGKHFSPVRYRNDGSLGPSNRSNIGNEQWEWLDKELRKYEEDDSIKNNVKVFCSGKTLNYGGKFKLRENTEQFNQLVSKITKLSNVVLLSGDIHKLKTNIHADIPIDYGNGTSGLVEIISSGIGRMRRNDYMLLSNEWNKATEPIGYTPLTPGKSGRENPGGYAILHFFPNGENSMKVKWHNTINPSHVPDDLTLTFVD